MKGGAVFFTSDLHLGHRFVAGLRGFDSPEEHDAAIADRWRSVIRPADTVFVLGDVTGGTGRLKLIDAMLRLAELPGTKHLIAGNHDAVHPMHRDAHKHGADYALAFASIASAGRRRIDGEEVLLSHFPYARDRGEARYGQWRLPNIGAWLLHGHTHGEERTSVTREPMPETRDGGLPWDCATGTRRTHVTAREIHVGLDAWDLTPVRLDTVAALIKEHTP